MEPDRFGSSFRNENLAISDSKNVKGSQNNLDVYDIYIYLFILHTYTDTYIDSIHIHTLLMYFPLFFSLNPISMLLAFQKIRGTVLSNYMFWCSLS